MNKPSVCYWFHLSTSWSQPRGLNVTYCVSCALCCCKSSHQYLVWHLKWLEKRQWTFWLTCVWFSVSRAARVPLSLCALHILFTALTSWVTRGCRDESDAAEMSLYVPCWSDAWNAVPRPLPHRSPSPTWVACVCAAQWRELDRERLACIPLTWWSYCFW